MSSGRFAVLPRSEYIGPNGVAADGLLLPDASVAIKAPGGADPAFAAASGCAPGDSTVQPRGWTEPSRRTATA